MLEARLSTNNAYERIAMENDLRYQVRSREIVDLYNSMRSSRLVLHAYFQRNLVWRDAHKKDFIDTILKGYPFPQIFLARGPINLESMEAQQCVVDGQQRLNAIREFIECKIDVNSKYFSDLNSKEKEAFLKYEVAVIDFDLESGDQRLKEVFHRLNRTYYSLSAIERLSSEYSSSEFLLVARALCGEIGDSIQEIGCDMEATDINEDCDDQFSKDPAIDEKTWAWLLLNSNGPYKDLLQGSNVFSKFEFDRKVPLMFTLNLMCTYISGSYYNRNDKVRRYLEDKLSVFQEKEEVIGSINRAASFIAGLNLHETSMWWSKSNFFTLMAEFSRNNKYTALDNSMVRVKLLEFEGMLPEGYALAAREAVSRKSQRETRAEAIQKILLSE